MQGEITHPRLSRVYGVRHTADYLRLIGVPELPPLTSPFDPGYDLTTFESHLDQSSHLMSIVKISMACWMVANSDGYRWRTLRDRSRARTTSRVSGLVRRHRCDQNRMRRRIYGHAPKA